MPMPRTSQELRNAVKQVFATVDKKLRQEGKTPVREIASVLNVSRQSAYQYLNGKVLPSHERLAKVLCTQDLQLEVNGSARAATGVSCGGRESVMGILVHEGDPWRTITRLEPRIEGRDTLRPEGRTLPAAPIRPHRERQRLTAASGSLADSDTN